MECGGCGRKDVAASFFLNPHLCLGFLLERIGENMKIKSLAAPLPLSLARRYPKMHCKTFGGNGWA